MLDRAYANRGSWTRPNAFDQPFSRRLVFAEHASDPTPEGFEFIHIANLDTLTLQARGSGAALPS